MHFVDGSSAEGTRILDCFYKHLGNLATGFGQCLVIHLQGRKQKKYNEIKVDGSWKLNADKNYISKIRWRLEVNAFSATVV